MIRAIGAAKPAKGDDVEFDNGHYFLTTKDGRPAIFHDGQYLKFAWSALKERHTPSGKLYWVIDTTDQSVERVHPAMTMYKIEIGFNGERLWYDIMSYSEGRAKNSAVGKLAKKLGVTIQLVWAMLSRDHNYIKAIS